MKLVVCLVLLFVLSNATKSKRFNLGDPDSKPQNWQLIPRSIPVPLEMLKAPNAIKPDDYFKFIPTLVGNVIPGKPITWSSPCFKTNVATLTITENSTAVLTLKTSDKASWFCDDGYLIGYISSFDITYFELSDTHVITWPGPWSDGELFDLQTHGLRIFKFVDGFTMTVDQIYETVLLFFGGLIGAHVPEWTAEDNLQFLQDHMGVTMPVRPINRVNITKTDVHSGDFLGVIRLDGLDPMLAWAMGAHTGHTTIAMWMDGVLNVCESTVKSAYWPTDGIQCHEWDEWMNLAQAASYNVVHLPLSDEMAAKFDVQNAIKFYKSVQGLPYGFHNLFTGWIDTPEDNYPPPLTGELVMLLAPFAEWLLSEIGLGITFDFAAQGMNKRLGTTGLKWDEIYMQSYKQGITFNDLVTMPELDEWIYQDSNGVSGPSMVCDVFVTRMWKAGGIFDPSIVNSIQATEFTNWDAYTLNIFNGSYVRPKQCVEADPDSQFCQLLGQYRMALPQYNTFQPFANMREKCPSLPPKYIKPLDC